MNEIHKNGGSSDNINIVLGDLNESECQDELIKSTLSRFGKIDILVRFLDFLKFLTVPFRLTMLERRLLTHLEKLAPRRRLAFLMI